MNILQTIFKSDNKPDHLELIAVVLTGLIYLAELIYVLYSSHTSYLSYFSIVLPTLLILFRLIKEIFGKNRPIIIAICLFIIIILALLACCKKFKCDTK